MKPLKDSKSKIREHTKKKKNWGTGDEYPDGFDARHFLNVKKQTAEKAVSYCVLAIARTSWLSDWMEQNEHSLYDLLKQKGSQKKRYKKSCHLFSPAARVKGTPGNP